MIMHRPHRSTLDASMKEMREFESLYECLETLIAEHNGKYPFQLTMGDIVIAPYGHDERVGWHDMFLICCVPYNAVNDKEGYEIYYGGKYDHPLQLFGMFTTNYERRR